MSRVRIPLSDGHMDVCLAPSASRETLDALVQVGEAALALLRRRDCRNCGDGIGLCDSCAEKAANHG